MKRQCLRLVNQIVQVFLLLLPVVPGPHHAEPEEGLLHGGAHGEDGVLLPEAEDHVHRRGIDAAESPEVPADVGHVLLGQELQADRLVLAVEVLEEVLDEDRELQRVRRSAEHRLDLLHGADPHLVPVHEGVLQTAEAQESISLGHEEMDLVEDDQLEDVPGIVVVVCPVHPAVRGVYEACYDLDPVLGCHRLPREEKPCGRQSRSDVSINRSMRCRILNSCNSMEGFLL